MLSNGTGINSGSSMGLTGDACLRGLLGREVGKVQKTMDLEHHAKGLDIIL